MQNIGKMENPTQYYGNSSIVLPHEGGQALIIALRICAHAVRMRTTDVGWSFRLFLLAHRNAHQRLRTDVGAHPHRSDI